MALMTAGWLGTFVKMIIKIPDFEKLEKVNRQYTVLKPCTCSPGCDLAAAGFPSVGPAALTESVPSI
jgi:hypothetical protein